TKSPRLRAAMTGITGTGTATIPSAALKPFATLILTTRACMISTPMDAGLAFPDTGRCGPRMISLSLGLPIKLDAGYGSLTMAGPGFPTSLGGGRRITMVAGFFTRARGIGGRVRSRRFIVRCGRRRLCSSLVSDTTLTLALVTAPLDGFLVDHLRASIP